ncbi:hypothetical protein PGTUg99_031531 [Puccinia graminis f. sp. tritici]|uniref:Protein arginine methyltransferase NDUFAF7 n=1 Tax=Puccinia graminis f. sp. tritici TaxID=56615 RepID=A0A5B0SLW5_PUCGR|nr:hypothetical protein PGTUg99_031531 [Puccinia graminis f. sp. tritici]
MTGRLHRARVLVSRSRYSTQPTRFNYLPDEYSQQEPTETQLVINQFSSSSTIKLLTTNELAKFNHPPRPSISLARDFIHDSLYNPNYGYFFNQVEILDRPETPTANFELDLYAEYFDPASGKQNNQLLLRRHLASESEDQPSSPADQRQIWHTPTELFKPWYAWSMAHYIVEKHLEKRDQLQEEGKELKIYEIGAGNGTLCVGILDYIKEHHPNLYEKTRYTTIELSRRLADRQREKIDRSGHQGRARVINRSILGLTSSPELEPSHEPCWVLGMEVLDNLARDVIRRDRVTGTPLQSIVITDQLGDFHERFIPITTQNNPNLLKYLDIFDQQQTKTTQLSLFFEKLWAKYLPFRSNLTQHQFIPTNYLILLQSIFNFFPNHRLILSDFSHLPNTLNDPRSNRFGAPVVQTRYNGVTVPTSTFLVKPGMFDIFFPTDFEELIHLYTHLLNTDHQQEADSSTHRLAKKVVGLDEQTQFLVKILASPSFRDKMSNINRRGHANVPDLDQISAYYHNVKVLTIT